MSSRYPGGLITAADNTPSTSSSTGVWKLEEAALFTNQSKWQIPIVPRMLFNMGDIGGGTVINTIETVLATTTGNATDFGDLTVARKGGAAASSTTRSVVAGGNNGSRFNTIDFNTFASAGNATDFGDLTSARVFLMGGHSSNTRALFGGGSIASSPFVTAAVDYITIASAGDGADFGDHQNSTNPPQGGAMTGSSTRAVLGGGDTSDNQDEDQLSYFTISSLGNGTDFGNLGAARTVLTAASSSTRAVYGYGYYAGNYSDVLEYITIASTGNSTDFGDQTSQIDTAGGEGGGTRGLYAGGGNNLGALVASIDFITIASTGDASDFGDMTSARRYVETSSSAHGGNT